MKYDLLLLPGLELTYNDADPDRAAHAVAVGLERHVSVDHGIGYAMAAARQAGAAIIAAHPFGEEQNLHAQKKSRCLDFFTIPAPIGVTRLPILEAV
jgi:hypothetical protein